ncbi:amino acid deaminase [Microbacterium sp. Marseille-Q6965]|uniref:amino acid deaminase n=1 Tax=Microbacterium sp. Marseille-Q6965 TaxID=2965072 RepID=UPI0021B80C53|nr:amino acid deaminase [Microbacterium sp. Marseille-Q6965]
MTDGLETALRCVRDDARAGRLELWGHSTVVDENVGTPVITRELFDALHRAAGIAAEFPVGNAGVVHVYGYFFSEVLTPYGYKSDRWNDGVLARALGLPDSAFRLGDSAAHTPLERVTAAALPLLLSPPADAVEVVDVSVGDVPTRAVVTATADGSGVLCYGVDEGAGMRLVTVFPVADAAAFAREAADDAPRLRWNAALALA